MSTPPAGLTALQGKHAGLAQAVYMQNPAAPGCSYHSGLDLEVVQQEIGWIGAVGGDTPPPWPPPIPPPWAVVRYTSAAPPGHHSEPLGARGGEDGPPLALGVRALESKNHIAVLQQCLGKV